MDARVDEAAPAGSTAPARIAVQGGTVVSILLGTSLAHGLNDTIQSLLPALYPLLRASFKLDYGQIGFITLAFQLTASLLQPLVGLSTDKRPRPYSLPVGMAMSLIGLVLLATASSYPMLLIAAASVGIGSSIFHPEAAAISSMG